MIGTKMEEILTLLAPAADEPESVRSALDLKRVHTREVAARCRALAAESGADEAARDLAERIGWCHDLGRFPQFREFQTFDDRISTDHARLSLQMVREHRLDADLSPKARGLLWAAIHLHNRLALPASLAGDARFFAGILRDADRLDIFRVFVDYYQAGPTEESPLELGYPDTGRVTPAVAESIWQGLSPPYELGRSVQDMRLIKLSWAYTLETKAALSHFLRCGIIEATQKVLPDTEEVRHLLDRLRTWATGRVG